MYENVPRGVIDYQPAPNNFINLMDDFSGLTEALAKLNEKLPKIEPGYPMILDSIAGSQLLVMKLAELESRIPLDSVASLLNQSLGMLRRRSKKWVKTKQ